MENGRLKLDSIVVNVISVDSQMKNLPLTPMIHLRENISENLLGLISPAQRKPARGFIGTALRRKTHFCLYQAQAFPTLPVIIPATPRANPPPVINNSTRRNHGPSSPHVDRRVPHRPREGWEHLPAEDHTAFRQHASGIADRCSAEISSTSVPKWTATILLQPAIEHAPRFPSFEVVRIFLMA